MTLGEKQAPAAWDYEEARGQAALDFRRTLHIELACQSDVPLRTKMLSDTPFHAHGNATPEGMPRYMRYSLSAQLHHQLRVGANTTAAGYEIPKRLAEELMAIHRYI